MIVVTGATGLVGNTLCRQLKEQGKEFKAMIHNPAHAASIADVDCKKVYGELHDVDSLVAAFQGADTVYHVAALICIVPGSYDKLYETNTQGVKNVLEACKIAGVKRLIHVASIEAFGNDGTGREVSEATHGFRPECAMIEYGATKALGGLEVLKAVERGDIWAAIVAPTGVLGPNDPLRSRLGCVVRDFVNGDLPGYNTGGGFAFVDSRDVAKCIILADEKGKNGEIYLATNEHSSTEGMMEILEDLTGIHRPFFAIPTIWMAKISPLAEKAAKALNMEPLITRGSMNILISDMYVSNAKSVKELGMTYIPLKQTISDIYDWYKAEGDIRKFAPIRTFRKLAKKLGL